MGYAHVSVLVSEILRVFEELPFELMVDGTLGLGGHTEALLRQNPVRRIIGLEWDPEALETARVRLAPFGKRFTGILGSYTDMNRHLEEAGIGPVDGVVLDLGLSSKQLADTAKGFSFHASGPLDMRMSPALRETAWDLLQTLDIEELAAIFYRWGEERYSRRIAAALRKAIDVDRLPNDASQVANVIRGAMPKGKPTGIDPATRCFQALRIAVNHELDNVDQFLRMIPDVVAPGGRAAIISFHSLEDRAVKHAFQKAVNPCVCPPRAPQCVCGKTPWGKIMTRKPVMASDEEIRENPRARSAKLRVLERIHRD